MKKKTLTGPALLGLIACSAAMAQSNVTLYGVLDEGLEFRNNVPIGAAGQSARQFAMSSGNVVGSRFGFKGTEDLGGGLKAVFVLESGYSPNNGTLAQGGRLFGRKAYVGFTGRFGRVTFGRHDNLFFEQMIGYDAMRFVPSYSAGSHDLYLVGREDNSIRYGGTFGRFTFATLLSLGYDSTIANGAQVPGASKVGRDISATLKYDTKPFSIGVAVDQRQGTSVATQNDKEQRVLVGAFYKYQAAQFYAGYRWLRTRTADVVGGSSLYWFGASYDVTGTAKVSASVYRTDTRNANKDPLSFAVLGEYSLSKATSLYAVASYAINKNRSNLGVRGFGTALPGENQTGVILGMRHSF